VPERAHLSIGEVLSLLREEFPDVTISKIRFLESQGLVDPERTPSGYRKFYEHDVERLRWILRQQREHFLPLKVIKGRLRAGSDGEGEEFAAGELPFPYEPPPAAPADAGPAAGDRVAPNATVEAGDAPRGATSPPPQPAAPAPPVPSTVSSELPVSTSAVAAPQEPVARHTSPSRRRASTATAPVPIISRAGALPPSPGARAVPSATTGPSTAPPKAATSAPRGIPAAAPAAGPAASAASSEVSASSAAPVGGIPPAVTPAAERSGPTPTEVTPSGAGRASPVEAVSTRAGSGPQRSETAPEKAAGAVPSAASAPTPAPAAASGDSRSGKTTVAPALGAKSATTPAPAKAAAPPTNSEDTFTREELAAACAIEVEQIVSLEQFGLISATTVAGTPCFDRDALAIAKAAAGLAGFGVEARHLRAWRNAADREASLFEQVVLPLVRQRNPQARQKAAVALEDLSRYGGELHAALLHRALRDLR